MSKLFFNYHKKYLVYVRNSRTLFCLKTHKKLYFFQLSKRNLKKLLRTQAKGFYTPKKYFFLLISTTLFIQRPTI